MTLPYETLQTGASATCEDCGTHLKPQVLQSAAGFYIGTACECGPYSRESGYYNAAIEALVALRSNDYSR